MKPIRTVLIPVLLCLAALFSAGCAESAKKTQEETFAAVYRGVVRYGAEETNKENKDSFLYRFEANGAEKTYRLSNGTKDENGAFDYPLQNRLKEGYSYRVTVNGGTVTDVSEIAEVSAQEFTPRVQGEAGVKTLKNFLKTALSPVGTVLYVYGGGWDWQDEGSSIQARTIGVSKDWLKFFAAQDASYTYKEKDGDASKADPANSFYPYGGYNEYYYAGLDCSGYLGWILYNTFETESGKDGYVGGSTGFAKRLAAKGWGEWTQEVEAPDGTNGFVMKPGDIMSINGHVWISLGTCADGSVVILHSTPSLSRTAQPGGGVQISAIGNSPDCEAYRLAETYMKNEFPEWISRYPVRLCDPAQYFSFEGENAGKFSWNTAAGNGLSDPDSVQEMTPEKVLSLLFE